MRSLGIHESSADVLCLLPLVWVAWSDGTLAPSEHAVITTAARERLKLSEDATRVLDSWLAHLPSRAYLDRGCAVLLELSRRAGGERLPLSELCVAVAKAEGSFFAKVSAPEKAALDEVAGLLAVDPSAAWEAVRSTLTTRDPAMEWLDEERTNPGVLNPDGAPAPAGPAGLAMGTGEGEERVIRLEEGITVGRGRENTLQLVFDAQAPRRHCEVSRRGDRVWVTDLGSLNGTLVEGERVAGRELFGGERIVVGETTLRWRA